MPNTIVVPDGAPSAAPFSPAVLASGARVLFVSGQLGEDDEGALVSEDAGEQAAQALRNVDRILAAAGATKQDVSKLTIYLTDLADREAVARARTAYFGSYKPASTGLVVAGLVIPGAKVEIEATAVF